MTASAKLIGESSFEVETTDRVDHAGGLVRPLDLDRDANRDLHAALHFLGGDHFAAAANARPGAHRGRKAHLLATVVHAHLEAVVLDELGQELARKAQRQVAVRDAAAERTLRRALLIAADP